MRQNEKIALESLKKEEYRRIICYPTCEDEDFKHRLKEMKELGVGAIEFTGQKQVYSTPVLGKGCVGIVVTAYRKGEKVALKIRRTDADRTAMKHEAQMLKRANKINVGPRFLGVTKDFLLMEYVEGALLPEWIKTLKAKEMRKKLRYVLRLLLEQAWRLDEAGLDHGELSHAPKHIIIKPNYAPSIVDFETASTSRHVANVTSLSQYLYIGSPIAKTIQRHLGDVNRDNLLKALRAYKKDRNRKNFEAILAEGGLT